MGFFPISHQSFRICSQQDHFRGHDAQISRKLNLLRTYYSKKIDFHENHNFRFRFRLGA